MRADILPVGRLREYRAASYPLLWQPQQRPRFLRMEDALIGAGGLPDSPSGWQCYASYLEWQDVEGPAGRSEAYGNLSRGWAIAGADFKADLLRDHAVPAEARAWEQGGVHEIRELRWQAALAKALAVAGKTPEEIFSSPKSAAWKLAIAVCLKRSTQVSNGWLDHHLHLGHAACCSSNLTRFQRQLARMDPLVAKLTQIFAT